MDKIKKIITWWKELDNIMKAISFACLIQLAAFIAFVSMGCTSINSRFIAIVEETNTEIISAWDADLEKHVDIKAIRDAAKNPALQQIERDLINYKADTIKRNKMGSAYAQKMAYIKAKGKK